MIPYDFYKQCIEVGFKLWDIVIWHKSVSGPAPDNNLTDKFEYVLIFYKKSGFYFRDWDRGIISSGHETFIEGTPLLSRKNPYRE